jgi:L-asparagine transporter-like permease
LNCQLVQFVVIVLGAETGAPATTHTTRAFGTPTIVHFCAVLLNAAILSAPWKGVASAAGVIAAFGLFGIAYSFMVLRHARRQTAYVPVLEDWIWHFALPLLAYAALCASGLLLSHDTGPALFAIGGSSLLLLFVGIHNAWDSVTYIALERRKGKGPPAG